MQKRNVSNILIIICLTLLFSGCSAVGSGGGIRVPSYLEGCNPTYRDRLFYVIDKEVVDEATKKVERLKVPSTVFTYAGAQKKFADEVGCLIYEEYTNAASKEATFISFYVENTNTLFYFILVEKEEMIIQYSFATMDEKSMVVTPTFFLSFKDTLDFFGKKPNSTSGLALDGPTEIFPMKDFFELLKELSNGKLSLD